MTSRSTSAEAPRQAGGGGPLADLTVALVGPGRVGRSLAAWAEARGARLAAVADRAAVDRLSSAESDLLLLAVPEAALAAVAGTLARRPQAAVALHTAGPLDASVLAPLRPAGSAIGTLHPLKAFPRPLPDLAEAEGTVFAIDGDPRATALAARLAAAWSGRTVEVPGAARSLYHLGATLSAGGVVTLVAAAGAIARRAGLPPEIAGGYLELARGAIARAAEAARPESALTGPVARGEADLVLRQLAELEAVDPPLARLVRELARETLRRLAADGGETPERRRLGEALDRG